MPKTKLSTAPPSYRLFCCLSDKTTTKIPSPSHTNNTLINVFHFLDSEFNSKLVHKKSNNQGMKVYRPRQFLTTIIITTKKYN